MILLTAEFNPGVNSALLQGIPMEVLFLRQNETLQLRFQFQLVPDAVVTEELQFALALDYTDNCKNFFSVPQSR